MKAMSMNAATNITIRKASRSDVADIARVHVDAWRTSYIGIIPQHVLDGLTYTQRETQWDSRLSKKQSKEVMLVATDAAKEIIGFINAGPARQDLHGYQGEIYALYILRDYQGKGVGRRFFAEVVKRLLKQGMKSMYVWVLADNPSRRFYENMKGERIATRDITIGGKLLTEIAYGWKDLTTLH